MELILLTIGIALCWGGYPLLERTVAAHPAWIAALLVIGSVPTGALGLIQKPELPTLKASIVILIAGLVLGLGMFFFGKILAWPGLEIGKIFPVLIGLATLVSAIGGAVFFGEAVTAYKLSGLAAILIGIYMLS